MKTSERRSTMSRRDYEISHGIIRQVDNTDEYYEKVRRYPDNVKKRHEARVKSANRKALAILFTRIALVILSIVLWLELSLVIVDWADGEVFDYDIIYTIAFCFIVGPACFCGISATYFVIIQRIESVIRKSNRF